MKTHHPQSKLSLKRLFELEQRGKYKEALTHLDDVLEDTSEDTSVFPNVDEFERGTAAEIILRCGSLIGFHGHNEQIPNSQENSKNLLTEARNRFSDLGDTEKIAECENYLALAYWRTGESVEAKAWIEEALFHDLPDSSKIRLYSFIVRCMIFLQLGKIEENILLLRSLESTFIDFGDDNLRGDFYNHFGLALRKTGKTSEALEKYRLAIYFHRKSGHQSYLGAIENNLAFLCKSVNKFAEAHEAADNATKIFKKIKDKTREGFSFDTKAQIFLAEGKYKDALKTSEKAIKILKKSENTAYLVESYSTRVKALLYDEDFAAATFCLFEAVELAKTKISEEEAKDLVQDYEALRTNNSRAEALEYMGKIKESIPKEKIKKTDEFDVALSFAGEDRDFVEEVYKELFKHDINVFYDRDEKISVELWGKELRAKLDEIYREKSKLVVIFVSKHYAQRKWTIHELRSALAKAMETKQDYVLPARFDYTELPGLLPTIGYINLKHETPESFARKIMQKLQTLP